MGKHAPGPWSVDMKSIGREWTDSVSILDAEGGHVAHLTRGYEGDENGDGCPSWANARLIAAAPEMLEALKGLLEWLEQPEECSAELHSCWQAASAAIAKAERPQNEAAET